MASPINGYRPGRFGRTAWEWLVLGCTVVALGGWGAWSSYLEHTRISAYEQRRLETQIRILDDRLAAQLASLAGALDGVRDAPEIFDRSDAGALTSRRLRALRRLVPGVQTLALVDTQGVTRAATEPELVGRSVAEQPFFTEARDHAREPDALRVLRLPAGSVPGIGEGAAVVRTLSNSGDFNGVAFGVLGDKSLQDMLGSIIYASDMRLTLATGDGRVLASAAGSRGDVAAAAVAPADRLEARYQVHVGPLRIDQPLFVVAERSRSAIDAPRRGRAIALFTVYLCTSLACAAGLSLSQRRRRERELSHRLDLEERRTEAERLDFILAGGSIGLWDWDVAARRIDFNGRWHDMLGLRIGDIGAGPDDWLSLVHPDDLPELRAAIARHWESDVSVHETEYRVRHRDGSWIWLLDRGKVLQRDGQGAPLRIVGAHMDVTSHKRADEALRRSEARFRALTELSSDWYWELDAQHRFAHFEGYSDTEIGMPREDNIGLTRWDLGALNMTDADWSRHRAVLDAHEVFQDLELQRLDTQGNVYWVSISGAPFFDAEGHFGGYRGIGRSITERKRVEDEIERLAFYDALTGLPNRRLLLDRLTAALARCRERSLRGALLFIDLDNFKDLNDTMGHDVGDTLLERVANRIVTCGRPGDMVARLGGDEFVVMLEGLPGDEQAAEDAVRGVAEHVLEVLNHPYLLEGYQHHSTPSVGIALFDGDLRSVDDLLKRADLAMYQAKAAGRNTLCFFHPDMQEAVTARSALEADLRNAIAHDELLLYFQPVVDHHNRLMGAEVLLRWRHPVRGMVMPGDFIALAEQTGLILALGNWVLETACRQLVDWAEHADTRDLSLAVNVSARQFRQVDFVETVLSVLERTGARPDRLKIELTESLLLNDVEDIIAKMSALKAHGVGFSLDDFGTGYSSLSYLKRLPLDQLKIDQSFVRDVLTDPNDAAIVNTILALARSLDLGVVAEGVETEGQLDFLRQGGCTAFQGYFFSRPAPPQEMLARWSVRGPVESVAGG
ncbi:EAL domain-containing protein [Xylophilus sp. GOD-11R]|uniref:bifunctional diguanylate cyclase/phosphodiesterase n=1 Tax=Xylophilus sp. GOD-11R TaxID=3089814 RepID=UPI00298D12CE|nr:EAL domain-containing protein [Xylophilus sp. GOD-11R]WPB58463.1 EAL domain-containing protein [Xylophilus sp. GOD-11R]